MDQSHRSCPFVLVHILSKFLSTSCPILKASEHHRLLASRSDAANVMYHSNVVMRSVELSRRSFEELQPSHLSACALLVLHLRACDHSPQYATV